MKVLAANAKYAENVGDKGTMPLSPSRQFAILTCLDARLDLVKYAGLAEGYAHTIRNAVARAMTPPTTTCTIS
jgi:carbonic anhydrase